VAPSLRRERALLRSGAVTVAGIDEVGRGSIAGPVSVGVVVVVAGTPTAPRGLNDSKLLSPARREELLPRLRRWAFRWSVGSASSVEIDQWGIMTGLRLAALRALAEVGPVDTAILDGSHDWLSGGDQDDLFLPTPASGMPEVTMRVKADQSCSAVAAASVLAKVARDREMVELHQVDHRYDWAANKGYASATHTQALVRFGPSRHHRRSWQLPGCGPEAATPFHTQATGFTAPN